MIPFLALHVELEPEEDPPFVSALYLLISSSQKRTRSSSRRAISSPRYTRSLLRNGPSGTLLRRLHLLRCFSPTSSSSSLIVTLNNILVMQWDPPPTFTTNIHHEYNSRSSSSSGSSGIIIMLDQQTTIHPPSSYLLPVAVASTVFTPHITQLMTIIRNSI